MYVDIQQLGVHLRKKGMLTPCCRAVHVHRYVSNQLPDLLERYRRRANRRLLLSLGDFVQSKGDGVDIYVVA